MWIFGQSYASFIEINFITQPEYKRIFENGYAPDEIIKSITFINQKCQIIPNDTLIFFDELQELGAGRDNAVINVSLQKKVQLILPQIAN